MTRRYTPCASSIWAMPSSCLFTRDTYVRTVRVVTFSARAHASGAMAPSSESRSTMSSTVCLIATSSPAHSSPPPTMDSMPKKFLIVKHIFMNRVFAGSIWCFFSNRGLEHAEMSAPFTDAQSVSGCFEMPVNKCSRRWGMDRAPDARVAQPGRLPISTVCAESLKDRLRFDRARARSWATECARPVRPYGAAHLLASENRRRGSADTVSLPFPWRRCT